MCLLKGQRVPQWDGRGYEEVGSKRGGGLDDDGDDRGVGVV